MMNWNPTRFSGLFIFSSFVQLPWAQIITVFELYEHAGKRANISVSSCSNLPSILTRNVASVKTNNNCARLYDETSCTGNFIEISPLAPSQEDLWYWNFTDKTVSAGPCPKACSTESVVRLAEKIIVTIFDQTEFKGSHHVIHFRGCTTLPKELTYSAKSIQTNGHCVQFYSNSYCKLELKSSIKLLPGTPHHDDLTYWDLPAFHSISDCSHNCRRSGNVFLYPSKFFTGSPLVLNVSTKCHDLSFKKIPLPGSAILSNITCISLFEKTNCKGTSFNVEASAFELSMANFDSNVESVVSCQKNIDTSVVQNKSLWSSNQSDSINKSSPLENSSGFPLYIITTIVVPVASVLLSFVIILYVLRRWQLYKNVINKLSEKEIREFLDGLGMDMRENRRLSIDNEYSTELLAQNKAYNKEYEIARHKIEIDSEVPLGKGQFGVVYKGAVSVQSEDQQSSTIISVAIKMANCSSGLHGLRSLLKEVKIMLFVGQHLNIARIIGCCTENLRQGELMVLIEYCSKGSLESYLVNNRHIFENLVKNGLLELMGDLQKDSLPEPCDYSVSTVFNIFQIAEWCGQVASGMEFLSNSKVVHSDLAARNVLLTDRMVAKISDFGLSRQLYNYSEYLKKQQEPLPWRWMALESLKGLEFSTKSDVWSYGVLIWEMFTLGEKPYPNLGWNEEFVSTLESGFRLSQPKNATNEFYSLMHRCWEKNPSNRPTFAEIVTEIKEIVSNYQTMQCIPDKMETFCLEI